MSARPQVVDPFVAAKPAPARPAAAPKPIAPDSPTANRLAHAPYRPPAGPLHTRYVSDMTVAPARTAVPSQPRSQQPARPAKPQLLASRPSTAVVPRRNVAPATQARSRTQSEPQTQARAEAKAHETGQAAAARPWSFEEPETWRDRPFKTFGLIVGGLLLGGLSLFSLELGEVALAMYAVLAIWRRWPSRQAFAVALGMFGGIIVTSLVSAWRQLADNLAVYAFLLLCVGTVLMAIEMRRDGRRFGKSASVDDDQPEEQPAAHGVYYRQRSL